MKNKKEKKYGFTLIELLATIVVLSLIMGITIYVAIGIIDMSKENSYKITKNNIEDAANEYLIENSDRLVFVEKDPYTEYQCVTIQELIDYDYFDNDILNSDIEVDDKVRKVISTDNVYLEREIESKNIKTIVYDFNNEYQYLCGKKQVYAINFLYSKGYSKSKEITITYDVKNLNNYTDIQNYVYKCEYVSNGHTYKCDNSNTDVLKMDSEDGNIKKLTVYTNGAINAWFEKKYDVTLKDDTLKTEEINGIDNEPPIINISDMTKIHGLKFDLYDNDDIYDNGSGVASIKVYLGDKEITSYKDLSIGDNVVTYRAEDKLGNKSEKTITIKIVVETKEFNYKEEDQIYVVLVDGTYEIEAYGAQGGNSGGKGGYVKAEVSLKAGDKLIINTGGVNGYNGGGGYKKSGYKPGGGATTVRYNNSYIIIAGGGGAKGNSGTPGAGGSGNGAGGGAPTNGKAGLSGTNGGGGSNSNNSSYSCNCQNVCGGWGISGSTYCGGASCGCNCYREFSYCVWWETICSTCTGKGKSGSGGSNKVVSPAKSVSSSSGNRTGNGYAKVSYKLED